MQWRWFLLVIVLPLALTDPASAGILFNRKTVKPDPANRVPELIVTLKTDPDERKRAAAAEELREYDTKAHAGIVPVLIEALTSDPKPGVRVEAAQSLGKLQPATREAGLALEQAVEKDTSKRVRWQARMSLWGYSWSGSEGAKGKDETPPQTGEPPLAKPAPLPRPAPAKPAAPATHGAARPLPAGPLRLPVETAEPPLAEPPPVNSGPVFPPR